MLDWNDVQYFLAIHRAGTLLGAARELKVEHSTVGRRLAAMEKSLKSKVFLRTPDGYQPTELGAAILPFAHQVETAMLQIERAALAEDGSAEGTVRVTTSESFAGVLGRWLVELHARHPGITVELLASNASVDLSRREADLAVRFSPTREAHLVCRRVVGMAWAPYASRSYVDARGGLPASGSLEGHDVIGFDDSLAQVPGALWLAQRADKANVVLRSGSIPAAVQAAAAGIGIAAIPCFAAALQPALVQLLPVLGTRDSYLVVHPDLARVARVRVVMAFLVERFAHHAPWLEGRAPAPGVSVAPAARAAMPVPSPTPGSTPSSKSKPAPKPRAASPRRAGKRG